MKIIKTIVLEGDEQVALCPSCSFLAYHETSYSQLISKDLGSSYLSLDFPFGSSIEEIVSKIIETESGADYGMIWCDNCAARCVFDPFVLPVKLTKEEAERKYHIRDCERGSKRNPEKFEIGNANIWEFEVAWINIMVDSSINDFIASSQLTRAQLENFYKAGTRPLDRDSITEKRVTLMRKYGIKYRPLDSDSIDPEDYEIYEKYGGKELLGASMDDEYDDRKDLDVSARFTVSSLVDNFDLSEPVTPYPRGTSLAHDGIEILLKCTSPATGKTFNYIFSGD